MIFRQGMLIACNANGRRYLGDAALDPDTADWPVVSKLLGQRYKNIPDVLGLSPQPDTVHPSSRGDTATAVRIERLEDRTKVFVTALPETPETRKATTEISAAARLAPYPIWRTNSAGQLIWANDAYHSMHNELGLATGTALAAPGDGTGPTRTRLGEGETTRWVDVTEVQAYGDRFFFATDAGPAVRAEIAQRNFVQTLTKTFAHLSIGLAIFDRHRQLVLFNPALIDLTALPADFLSARPNLLTFFDRMRDNRIIPEPKNYSTWRERIAELVAAASDDRFSETWTLPSGLTYRVSGRPHPDGAIAFLFEDISAEISLTRRFRADLELGQSVLDAVDPAVVVFATNGVLSLCNTAYCTLWDSDPETGLGEYAISEALNVWESACQPSAIWERVADSIMTDGAREPWSGQVSLRSGRVLNLHLRPVSGGATVIVFEDAPKMGLSRPGLARKKESA